MIPWVRSGVTFANRLLRRPPVRCVASARLPTDYGEFDIHVFKNAFSGETHVALVRGEIGNGEHVLTRVHSACLTGDLFQSARCDCGQQLRAAMQRIAEEGRGVLLYLDQEGRGIGLVNKIRAYALQDRGHDTVEANHLLGFGDDERDYRVASDMVQALGIASVRLMTNNPRKVEGLRGHGVAVSGRIPIVTPANRHNAAYLLTKQRRSGHLLAIGEALAAHAGSEQQTA